MARLDAFGEDTRLGQVIERNAGEYAGFHYLKPEYSAEAIGLAIKALRSGCRGGGRR